MNATLTYTPGKTVWRELFTPDVPGAKRFYGALFGWTFSEMPMGEGEAYTVITTGEKGVGGIMDLAHLPEDAQVPPHWGMYVSVADVDAGAERAVAAGGTLLSPGRDIPNVGRFAVIQDPQGGLLNLFRSNSGDGAEDTPGVGEFAFELLTAPDPAAAAAFYTAVVGWSTQVMGPATMLMRDEGQRFVASVCPGPAGASASWLTHVVVADLAAVNAQARALGGEVVEERIEVPGYGLFALIKDPDGAYFMTYEAVTA